MGALACRMAPGVISVVRERQVGGGGGSGFIHHAAVSLGDTDVRVARTRSSLLSVIDSCAICDRSETIYYSTIEMPDQRLVL